MDIKSLLQVVIKNGASDLHIIPGRPPMVRIDGQLQSVAGTKELNAVTAESLVISMMSAEQKELFQLQIPWEN